ELPWPNLVVEVAYYQTEENIMTKVQKYLLYNDRVHDVIVVKIDPVPVDQVPSRFRAWHFCVSYSRLANGNVPARNMFEFGTHDVNGGPLNFEQGTCVINIKLD
ncbi:14043_t:CDS:2, partial [Funneliformis mosseae]